jgi:hypothetical protein
LGESACSTEQIWLNLLMDDYHFAPWVNQLVAQNRSG